MLGFRRACRPSARGSVGASPSAVAVVERSGVGKGWGGVAMTCRGWGDGWRAWMSDNNHTAWQAVTGTL